MSNVIKGFLFASLAALLNASIGIFSKILINQGLNVQDISFLKTTCAFVVLSIILAGKSIDAQKYAILLDKSRENTWFSLLWKIAICAFLGIFVLFFFETVAYQYGFASNVVVVLMASAAISALILGRIILGEQIVSSAIVGVLLSVIGIFIISWSDGSSYLLILNATLAGAGYGAFSVLVQRFGLMGGFVLTRILMFFGSLYLLFPFVSNLHPISWNWEIYSNIIGLAIFPTILGFYCTTKALVYLSAAKVQVTELSEPIFAAVLAWIFIEEIPKVNFFIGAMLIILGIISINQMFKIFRLPEVKFFN